MFSSLLCFELVHTLPHRPLMRFWKRFTQAAHDLSDFVQRRNHRHFLKTLHFPTAFHLLQVFLTHTLQALVFWCPLILPSISLQHAFRTALIWLSFQHLTFGFFAHFAQVSRNAWQGSWSVALFVLTSSDLQSILHRSLFSSFSQIVLSFLIKRMQISLTWFLQSWHFCDFSPFLFSSWIVSGGSNAALLMHSTSQLYIIVPRTTTASASAVPLWKGIVPTLYWLCICRWLLKMHFLLLMYFWLMCAFL